MTMTTKAATRIPTMAAALVPPGFLTWVSWRGVSVGTSLFPSIFAVIPPVSQVESFPYNSYDWTGIFQGKHLKWKVKFSRLKYTFVRFFFYF